MPPSARTSVCPVNSTLRSSYSRRGGTTLLGEGSRQAIASGSPAAELRDNAPTIYVAIPTKQLVAEVRLPPPPPPLDRCRAPLLTLLTLVGVIAVLFPLIRSLEHQLGELIEVAERIGPGKLKVRSHVSRRDAVGDSPRH